MVSLREQSLNFVSWSWMVGCLYKDFCNINFTMRSLYLRVITCSCSVEESCPLGHQVRSRFWWDPQIELVPSCAIPPLLSWGLFIHPPRPDLISNLHGLGGRREQGHGSATTLYILGMLSKSKLGASINYDVYSEMLELRMVIIVPSWSSSLHYSSDSSRRDGIFFCQPT
jgi:hypothetical protein